MNDKKIYPEIRKKYFWEGIYSNVHLFCESCPKCKRFNEPHYRLDGKLQSFPVQRKFETVGLDLYHGVVESYSGNTCVLVITCFATKFSTAIPLPDAKSAMVAKAFLEHWIKD